MLNLTGGDISDLVAPGNLRSQPLYFDGCFGWLHDRADRSHGGAAVVLCSGLKEDKITGHRSFRLLADDFAARGYPTLRFDYRGTGDSRDIDDLEPWTEWQHNIHSAACYLRRHVGARRIVLCGLRIGATLAALVAQARDDVGGLILLAPVIRGRTYIRQISVESHAGRRPVPGGGLMLEDLWLPAETVEAISRVDLRTARFGSVDRILVDAPDMSPLLSECAASWTGQGADTEIRDFRGLDALLRPAFMCHEEQVQTSRISDWLSARIPTSPRAEPVPDPVWDTELELNDCVETPLRFGARKHLFGMLCRPTLHETADFVIVIVNASGDPHYGFARAGTDLARQLAAAGLPTLRLDFDALGDSGVAGAAPSHVFETDRRQNVAAAVDALAALGFRRFALQGLCSGAYHALHAALDDPRIDRLMLINLPLFQWHDGDAIELVEVATESRAMVMRKVLRNANPRLLLRAFLGLDSTARTPRWFAQRAKVAGQRIAGLSKSRPAFARKSFRHLARRTETLLLYGEDDPGLKVLYRAFGRNKPPGATIQIIAGLDHGLATSEMRRIAAARIVAFLGQNEASGREPLPGALASDRPRPDTGDDAWHGARYQTRRAADEACPP
jgi:pimeloyl-ACP methyl ester carboxylesterase